MTDEQHPYADPWGLPTEDSPDEPSSPPPPEPEPEAASTEQPEPESVEEPEAEGTIEQVDDSTEKPEEAAPEPDLAPEHEALISPTHIEARNVLDTLGAGFDDLPEEPPDWMDSTTTSAPPSVYRELSELTTIDDAQMAETEVAETEVAETEVAETEVAETEVADEAVEAEGTGIEEDLESMEAADTTGLEEDLEPEPADAEVQTPEADLEEDLKPEPADAQVQTPDVDLDTDIDVDLEPEPTEPIEPDLDEAVASALSAIETPDVDLEPTESIEPGPEPTEPIEPDLDEAVASALSAVEPSVIAGTQEPGLIESPSVAWGSNWGSAAQGWIRQEGGRSTWRPIVTTTSDVGAWEVDTFLGIVAGDATVAETGNLAGARKTALQALVDEALSRGAHAVVGVHAAVHEVGRSVIFSAIGTAVTLRNPS